jgi:hypothetical protein
VELLKRTGESELDRFESWLVTRGKMSRLVEYAIVFAGLLWYLGLVLATRTPQTRAFGDSPVDLWLSAAVLIGGLALLARTRAARALRG